MCVSLICDSLPVQTDKGRLEWEWLCEDEISYLGKGGWGREERAQGAVVIYYWIHFLSACGHFMFPILQPCNHSPTVPHMRCMWHNRGVMNLRLNCPPYTPYVMLSLNKRACLTLRILLSFLSSISYMCACAWIALYLCVFLRRETLLQFPSTHPYGAYVTLLLCAAQLCVLTLNLRVPVQTNKKESWVKGFKGSWNNARSLCLILLKHITIITITLFWIL